MLLQRSAFRAVRRAVACPITNRSFTSSLIHRRADHALSTAPTGTIRAKKLEEIESYEDLLAPGAAPGTVPTDLEQAVGAERLEILGKMQGVDVFDMRPLDSSRLGTMDDPIIVKSAGDEQYVGCTGSPADSHVTIWLTMSRDRPIERCPECGNVFKMEYVGPENDAHDNHHGYEEPKTWADYVRPEYRY